MTHLSSCFAGTCESQMFPASFGSSTIQQPIFGKRVNHSSLTKSLYGAETCKLGKQLSLNSKIV
jgi:hypothetical protein